MATYNEYSIQDVLPDLSKKQIVIKTNFQVDPDTVDLSTVQFYNYDKTKIENYELKVNGKDIIIQLSEYPNCDTRYYLKIEKIKDALGRKLATNYNDYIKFYSDVTTKVEILSPMSRQTYNTRTFEIKLKATEIVDNLFYKIEIGMDNAFFSTIAVIRCNGLSSTTEDIESEKIKITGSDTVVDSGVLENNIIKLNTRIEREGQLYIRARAELSDAIVGDWSEVLSFNIYTISMDSIETTFLEDYLTTDELFEEESLFETEITDKTDAVSNDGLFYLEFNKEIKLPDNYEVDENGYVNLGVVLGTRKELK